MPSLQKLPSFHKLALLLVLTHFLFLPAVHGQEAAAPVFSADFEESAKLPAGWTSEGSVVIDTQDAFKGTNSLLFSRTPEVGDAPCTVTGPVFPTAPGLWDINLATKSDLKSPDGSFDAWVTMEFLDASGKVIDHAVVADIYAGNPWQPTTNRIEVPKGTTHSRLRVELRKTSGRFWMDEITARYAGPAPHRLIDRLVFSTVALGNLLYPTDSRVIHLRVVAREELPKAQRLVNFTVCDYWGAEQMTSRKVVLKETGREGKNITYEGSIDIGDVPLEVGRYYEMVGLIPQDEKPFRNYSGLAILPEAITNSYPAGEIPFAGRNWDGRMADGFHLSHRMGIRIMNIWCGWKPVPPYTPDVPCIELCEKYKMGAIFGTPTSVIERQAEGWDKYDEASLRGGIRNLLTTYGKSVSPFIIDLGNEPPVIPERIPIDIKNYGIIYDEVKKIDPSVMVLGTSIGANEDFFKAGMGQYCDAYDFHVYESPRNVALTFENYKKLFATYDHVKPIWSTELGLNSEGMSRQAVAIDMVKKFAYFFAGGGANLTWFDLFYPDPDAKIAGLPEEAHNVFDSRYVKYNPKLTAITDFDLINAISIKKFVAEKSYGDVQSFLMRDKDNHNLQIIWKDNGRQDVELPLADVQQVEVIRLDGTHRKLNAGGKGITLTVDEDPLLLLYDGTTQLADSLGEPAAQVTAMPKEIIRGGSADVTVELRGAKADSVELVPPPFWHVKKKIGSDSIVFTASVPESSAVRAADMTVALSDGKGGRSGELYLRPAVASQIQATILPVPIAVGKTPAVKLVMENKGAKKEDVSWTLALVEELPVIKGRYDKHQPAQAHFTETPKGELSLAPGAQKEITLSLAGTDPFTVYRVRGTVTDSTGATARPERNVAGFVGVPKVKDGEIKFDGVLDEGAWKNAPVEKINEERQYCPSENAKWKGPADLSGTLRFLWDDHYLYVGVEVTDDIKGGMKQDDAIWAQDGLQFLIDPCRGLDEGVGKYDYSVAEGLKGLQAWCNLSAGAPTGDATSDIKISAKRPGDGTGAITYEIAFPWSRIIPFKPADGADLGLTLILNEDDGQGRHSFMTWLGDAEAKRTDPVADLILMP